MRLRRIGQSVWMYGFPIRKHHYTDRSIARKYTTNISDKYAELKFIEHASPSSSYRRESCGNKTSNSPIKVFEKRDSIAEVCPIYTTSSYSLQTKNEMVAEGNGVVGRFVGYEDEFPPEANIHHYGNVSGLYTRKYKSSNFDDVDQQDYPSTSGQAITRWTDTYIPTQETSIRVPIRPAANSSLVSDQLEHGFERLKHDDVHICQTSIKQRVDVVDVSNVAESLGEIEATETPLLKAVKLADTNILCDLLNENITEDINAVDFTGRTVLSYIVLKNCVSTLERILKIPNVDVNKSDNEGNSPLHFSAQAGQVESLSILLNTRSQFCLEVDCRNIFGFTPLMKAALQGRTKCAKLLLFAGASPTMRDAGRRLRAEQWARYCGRYSCADVIEKYARNQLLSKTASYGNWGDEPELGLHFINGKLQPPAIALQNALNQSYKNNGIKSKLKKAFHRTNPSNWRSSSKTNSFSPVAQLTTAALCVSSPVLPNSSKVSPVVKSLIKPFVIPKIEITPDTDPPPSPIVTVVDRPLAASGPVRGSDDSDVSRHSKRKLSYLMKLRKKSYF